MPVVAQAHRVRELVREDGHAMVVVVERERIALSLSRAPPGGERVAKVANSTWGEMRSTRPLVLAGGRALAATPGAE